MATFTSLNLQALLKTAIARGALDAPAGAVSGLTPSASALYVANAAHALPSGAVLYVVPGDGDIDESTADVRFFLAALEGLSEAAADRAVLPFPSHEIDPYRGLAPHVGVTSARARVLHALATGTTRIVVASAAALLPRVSAPDRLLAASIELRPGQDIAPADLGDLLVDAGFSREDPADEHGEFAIRGGIVDIFPAGEAEPVRLEFIGDTIESLRTYDPATQRSTKSIDQITIVPLRDVLPDVAGLKSRTTNDAGPERAGLKSRTTVNDGRAGLKSRTTSDTTTSAPAGVVQDFSPARDFRPAQDDRSARVAQDFGPARDDRSATVFDYLARAKTAHVIVSEPDEVEVHAVKLLDQARHSYEELAGLSSHEAGLESRTTANDGRAGLKSRTTSGSYEAGLKSRTTVNGGRAERLVPRPEALFVDWDDVRARLAQGTALMQLGVDEPSLADEAGLAHEAGLKSRTTPGSAREPGVTGDEAGLKSRTTPGSAREPGVTGYEAGLKSRTTSGSAREPGVTGDEAGLESRTTPGSAREPGVTGDEAGLKSRTTHSGGQATHSGGQAEPRASSPHVSVRCQPSVELRGRVADWVAEISRLRDAGATTLFVAATPGRAERTIELLKEYDVFAAPIERAEDARYAAVLVAVGRLSRGFRLLDAGLRIYAETDVFEEERHAAERRRPASKAFLSDLRDLKVGDFVVHVDHGIGLFVGLKQIGVGDAVQEFLELRYAGDDKLFVPVERLDLVQKYTGANKPPIDKLGGASWERAKTRVKKAMRDMAEELLKLYAARKAVPGHAFSPDSHWQQEFEDAFEYELTPDQRTAIADIKRDMESPTPMDRLLCGDVGYGKTEVAMRAAFKTVMDGKQVAFLAPTTVLAFQHQKTLKERFAAFPVRIEMVSRFRSKAEQKDTLTDLGAGKVDIIVGTHRLLSKDVEFRDLGLLVVDEEQRFGVAHKERIKQLKKKIDVLTMTATPIPRTLNMSLVGIRDMSIIETPPKDRLSIQTNVVKFDSQVIARAIRNEMERGGQVYFVHNRVESIFSIGNLVQRLVPDAKVVVGHGQMDEDALERAMLDFVAKKFDVLLATTIVENGLDIPNANTIIINRADRYGLSQLYQLRGRVGRSDRPAYAYLLIPPEDSLSPVAKKRLAAIKEFSDLGSGFRVAALDLEIRGAGNLLGGEQSGHIETLGFEMYMKLLEQTVHELKGEEIETDLRANVNLGVDLRVEESYVPDMNQRLMLYRKVAAARREPEIDRVLEEASDRYGPLPESVLNLADYGRIRVMADRLDVDSVDREGRTVVIKFRPQARIDLVRLVALVGRRPELTLVPPAALRLSLAEARGAGPGTRLEVRGSGLETRERPATLPASGSRAPSPQPLAPSPRKGSGRSQAPAPSWWTARARAGEVTPGFTKEDILRPAKDDPRGPGGVFEQVGGLLSDLLEQG